MSKIKLLSSKMINIIAAGEVIERPSSIVKELVENSIDANSKNISISITNGGKSSIVIKDDGNGIDNEDIYLAIKRHATSKLINNDISKINTLGFRGEALPSIAAISNIKIISRSSSSSTAYYIKAHADNI